MKPNIIGDKDAHICLVQAVDEHDVDLLEKEYELIKGQNPEERILLAAVRVNSWNHDLSPWPAAPVFGKEGFGGKAKDTLDEVLKLCADKDKTYIIGGYSLAALFSLWAVYQTDIFAAAAAASPSVWFPGFTDLMEEKDILTRKVYLSLGDREEKTRNPVMATVGDRIRNAHEILAAKGTDCVLEWNAGNHFKEADLRTAKAFAWALDAVEV